MKVTGIVQKLVLITIKISSALFVDFKILQKVYLLKRIYSYRDWKTVLYRGTETILGMRGHSGI